MGSLWRLGDSQVNCINVLTPFWGRVHGPFLGPRSAFFSASRSGPISPQKRWNRLPFPRFVVISQPAFRSSPRCRTTHLRLCPDLVAKSSRLGKHREPSELPKLAISRKSAAASKLTSADRRAEENSLRAPAAFTLFGCPLGFWLFGEAMRSAPAYPPLIRPRMPELVTQARWPPTDRCIQFPGLSGPDSLQMRRVWLWMVASHPRPPYRYCLRWRFGAGPLLPPCRRSMDACRSCAFACFTSLAMRAASLRSCLVILTSRRAPDPLPCAVPPSTRGASCTHAAPLPLRARGRGFPSAPAPPTLARCVCADVAALGSQS